ncbi:AzlC family ABC transporter permease [Consotaella aegiceratis]|uniref:AzlC family ABC transporter permease n=1 Tax=Consotaella aegiceratis TaxID=3097961 RepID=UPI002F3FDE70
MSTRSEIRDAARDVLPVIVAIFPFGIVYGTIAADSGLTILQTLGYSMAVYAGAGQLAALQVLGIGAPLWTALLSLLALNARMILYSASIGRHLASFSLLEKAGAFFLLTDPAFGASEARALNRRLTSAYYFTHGFALYANWCLASVVGAVFGRMIDDTRAFALDVILPVYFLSILMGFRHRSGFYAVAGVSAVVSTIVYLTIGPPWHVTLGAVSGLAYAAITGQGASGSLGRKSGDE